MLSTLLPIIAAFLQASSFTLDKVILSVKRVDFKTYIGVSFPLIFLINLAIFFIFRPPFSLELLSGRLLFFLLSSVFLSICTNILYYRALDRDKLTEMEVIGLLSTIPVVIFSGIIFADERNFYILIPALVAFTAIVWSHWKGGKILIKKDTRPFLIWMLLLAPLGAALSKILLQSWNPISLELVRSAVLIAALTPLFHKNLEKVSPKAMLLLLLTNILTAVAWIFFYFSFKISGVVYTLLLFSLQPLLVYFAAVFILKEKLEKKKFIAFMVVLASIAIAQFFTGE